jgi:hypothetical protein
MGRLRLRLASMNAGEPPSIAAAATSATPAAATPPSSPPAPQSEDVHCPMCEYNLRGLSEPRCPECGFRFEWAELRDARRRPHRYLFEHHPEANVKSFWKTVAGGLRPWRFWKELHPGMPSRPGRLVLYWLIGCALAFAAVLAFAVPLAKTLASAAAQVRLLETQNYSPVTQDPNYLPNMLDANYPMPPRREFFHWLWLTEPTLRMAAELTALVLAWPWLTLAVLMIFRVSMSRARVRSIHVVRCIVYGYDAIVWAALLLIVLWLPIALLFGGGGPPGAAMPAWNGAASLVPYPNAGSSMVGRWQVYGIADAFGPIANVVAAAILALGALRLVTAYRRYLRFDWPGATVVASQVILLLALVILATNVRGDHLLWYWRRLLGV